MGVGREAREKMCGMILSNMNILLFELNGFDLRVITTGEGVHSCLEAAIFLRTRAVRFLQYL